MSGEEPDFVFWAAVFLLRTLMAIQYKEGNTENFQGLCFFFLRKVTKEL
jgi:hypothetical protein